MANIGGPGDRPEGDDCFCDGAYRGTLGHDQKTGARLPGCQTIAEVIEHGPAIMRHKNTAVGRGTFEKFRIGKSIQACLLSRRKVDGWLLPPSRPDDCEPEVVVCLKA
jgi:hypothetical protein